MKVSNQEEKTKKGGRRLLTRERQKNEGRDTG
jgi:hypothetical protein